MIVLHMLLNGVTRLQYLQTELNKAKRKKMRSTHACTPFFALLLFSIFTVVVVYSRTSSYKTKKKLTMVLIIQHRKFFVLYDSIILAELIKRAQRKKMRSTHACTPSFSLFLFSIFTSVVVYSRTTKKNHNKNQKKMLWFRVLFWSCDSHVIHLTY